MKRGIFPLIWQFLIYSAILFTGCGNKLTMIAGGFTETGENGMSVFKFNTNTGALKMISVFNAGPNPSWFCFSKRHNLIYALNEVMEFTGLPGGGITTLHFNPQTGAFEKKGEIVIPYGGPCHLSVSADNSYLFVANYASGSIAVAKLDESGVPAAITYTILYETDSLNVSHAHMILQDPKGKHVYVTDLGLDRIIIYDFDNETGKLAQIKNGIVNLPKGSGPRHFTFNSDGSVLYVINESGSTVLVFKADDEGGMELIQTISTLPAGFYGKNSCAEILISKNGKFIYGSNRGDNSIVVYKVSYDGTLILAGHSKSGGDWPRNFVIDPTGKFLLAGNQKSDMISVLKIDNETGIPEMTNNSISIKAPAYLEFWR
jgi:6-phosphogluconolactonase